MSDLAARSRSRARLLTGVLIVVGALGQGAPARAAATFTVNSATDAADASAADGLCRTAGGVCSVRAALQQANALLGPDEVRVPAGGYAVTLGPLPITSAITLAGTAGARVTTLDAHGTDSRLDISGSGPVSVRGITLTGEVGAAAAVVINGPEVTMTGVDIHGNRSSGVLGGGILVSSGGLALSGSAVTGNTLERAGSTYGGGVAIAAGNAAITSTTIAGNRAAATDLGTSSFGGGIYAQGTSLTLRHVTLLDNTASSGSASQGGGNLAIQSGDALVADSIIARGASSTGPNCYLLGGGALTVSGKNIYGGGSCGFPAANVVSAVAQVTALADHGGTGATAVPLAGSAAIDAAAACPTGGGDQRGAPAPTGLRCDIGAAEAGADLRVTLAASTAVADPGDQLSYVAKVVNGGLDDAPATVLTLAPPAGVAPLLVVPSAGTCASTAVCALGTLAPGQSATVTVVVRVPASGPLAAGATATSALPDPTPANARAGATTSVRAAGADTQPPVVSGLSAKGRLKARRGGTLKATLSEAATVRIAVARLTQGRRAGGRCSAHNRTGRRCTIAKKRGSVTADRPAGAITIRLPGRLGGRALAAGRYRLKATAVDGAGNRSLAVTSTVTVRKR